MAAIVDGPRTTSDGLDVACCPECHAVVQVRYTASLAGWLMQTKKDTRHAPWCSAYRKDDPAQ